MKPGVLLPMGVGLGLGAAFILLSHSSEARPKTSAKPVPPPPAPKKPSPPKTQPSPKPSPSPYPGPDPGPAPQYMYPVGSVVQANVERLGRREPGIQSVKIIKNRGTGASGLLGDYEVIADDCFFPDSLCSSAWIRQSDIVD